MKLVPGMRVEDEHGHIGYVSDIRGDVASGLAELTIRRLDNSGAVLPPGSYQLDGAVVRIAGVRPAESFNDPYQTQLIVPRIDELQSEASTLTAGEDLRIPVVREELVVGKEVLDHGGVRIQKRVDEREHLVEQPLLREGVTVERIPIGQPVTIAPAVREEGDRLIIPVLEEVLVVEKRLILKEEIHIIRHRTEEVLRERVLLREEHVDLTELPPQQPLEQSRGAPAEPHNPS